MTRGQCDLLGVCAAVLLADFRVSWFWGRSCRYLVWCGLDAPFGGFPYPGFIAIGSFDRSIRTV